MNLTRQSFTADSLRIMDQVSHLIFIAEQVIEFGKAAAESRDFDVAEIEAKKIAHYAEVVSADLTSTIFHTKKNRHKLQKKAYRKALDGFGAAYAAALKLVEIDRAATAGEGKSIGGGVVARLDHLKQVWDDRCGGGTDVSSIASGGVAVRY